MNFRFNALLAAAILSSGGAAAGPKEDVLGDFARCTHIAAKAARLACYDSLAPRVKALTAPPAVAAVPPIPAAKPNAAPPVALPAATAAPPPPVATAAPPPKETAGPESFGAEELPQPEASAPTAEVDSITARLSGVTLSPLGKFTVVLDNGQVWRQLGGDSQLARFKEPAGANTVTISRGLFGSYNLSLNDTGTVFKVQRVK